MGIFIAQRCYMRFIGYILLSISTIFLGFNSEKKTILFYGDSLTAGYGLSKEQAFPAIVERKLNGVNGEVKVINAGLSGETTAGGLNRLSWVLKEPVDIFILELGANDGLRGLPLDQTEKNLQLIIDAVKKENPTVEIVIAGMMVPPNLGKEYTNRFKSIFPKLAKSNNAKLIPFLLDGVAGDETLNLADGIHPNPEGHKIVADNVLKVLETIL